MNCITFHFSNSKDPHDLFKQQCAKCSSNCKTCSGKPENCTTCHKYGDMLENYSELFKIYG